MASLDFYQRFSLMPGVFAQVLLVIACRAARPRVRGRPVPGASGHHWNSITGHLVVNVSPFLNHTILSSSSTKPSSSMA
jgi:hypothetical protein